MNILAIETSCDETAVAVIEVEPHPNPEVQPRETIRVLSNVVSSQIAVHEKFGGVVPMLAAREHAANIQGVFDTAVQEAFPNWEPAYRTGRPETGNLPVDLLAVTHGPGLGPALIVGIHFAKALAQKWNKPLIGVDHMDGHIHSNWLSGKLPVASDQFPALNLIVSGGHTDLVLMRDHGAASGEPRPYGRDYTIVGETLDDAVGEAFDKVARMLDLGYPGGPKISKLAQEGSAATYNLPRPMLKSKDFNFSYSGLKTAVLYLIKELQGAPLYKGAPCNLSEQQKADIAASFQEAAIDVLIQKTRRATQQYGVKTLLLSGGVSANHLLRTQFTALGDELSIPVHVPDLAYTGDNAAMIAVAAYFARDRATTDWSSIDMDANLRLGQNGTE